MMDVSDLATEGEKEPSLGNMEPLVGRAACSRKTKRSAANSNNSKKASDPAEALTILKKHTKRPRLKCDVCCRGFQKKRALLRHKQSHVSGAFSERYSEMSASCGSPGSVARVQRYLTLNIAMAMKLRESRFYDRHKPARGVSKDMKRKKGLKGSELKQMKGTKKLAHIPKHRKMDMVFHSQSQSDKTPVIKSETEGMIETTQSSSTILSENGDGLQCINSENPLEISAMNVSMGVKSKESSKSVLEMVSDAWNILDTDSTEVQQPQKFNLKAIRKDTTVYTNMTTGDESPKAVTLSDQQVLGESLHSNQVQQAIQLDSLNQESIVTAMHDRVVELVTSLQGERDKHLVMPQSSQSDKTTNRAEAKSSGEESESDDSSDDDDDCYPNWNDEGKSSVSNRKDQPSMKRRRNRAKKSTFCEICQKDFKNLNRHLIIHNGERKHKCNVCGKAFYEARVLDKHETTHMKKFKCGVCGEMFSKVRAAKRHARIHVPDKPYSCEICKLSFQSRSHVRKHMLVHSSVRPFICDICGQGMRSITALNCHKRKHTGEKPLSCEICGKSFRYSSGLHVHSFSHTSGKPYNCPICRESFAHNYLRKRHLLTHQADQPSVKDSQREVSRSLSSLNTGHAEQEDLCHSIHQLSSNSQTMASTSRVEHKEQTASSSEEPLIQGVGAVWDTLQTEQSTPQASSKLSTQPSSHDDQLIFANEARKINKVLGPDSFLKQNLLYGTGSRRQTPVDSLVVTMCDGSYKSLKDLQRQERESKDMKQ